ncbi:serine hydrolase family protein [Cellulophaga baltica]|uniref:alpha/beta hydrolase n=1 Tax=Cellulophaga TaxID=104264 RepID=UPI001C079587|nr:MULTISPECIES: serine hydrolase family protein [Cellulophaga]MBU2996094.1 serine hydrolase family protein [Cellulophaga baltica]MDO6767489.1 serine hydrolase family protein [Cellulophaga sp. 1_MG-2023]
MNSTEKTVSYTTTNTYETLNIYTPKTENVWLVFHGIGFLSRYFLKYFKDLNSEKNYIISPQAPSKYYLNNAYKHVGASWLTKENTDLETKNIYNYIDSVLANENISADSNLILFGFSQGVSIATRYLKHKQLKCDSLILYAGSIPNELTKGDFDFITENKTKVKMIVGTEDEYITKERLSNEIEKAKTLFNEKAILITFEGGHEVKKNIINALVQ